MRRVLYIIIGLFVMTDILYPQISASQYLGRTHLDSNPYERTSHESQQLNKKAIFNSQMDEYLVEPEDITTKYAPISAYSSTIFSPFPETDNDVNNNTIRKVAPGEGQGTGVQDPIGSPVFPLLLMLVLYTVYKYYKQSIQKNHKNK